MWGVIDAFLTDGTLKCLNYLCERIMQPSGFRIKKHMSLQRRHGNHGNSGLQFRGGVRICLFIWFLFLFSCESINARLLFANIFIQVLSG